MLILVLVNRLKVLQLGNVFDIYCKFMFLSYWSHIYLCIRNYGSNT